jgi:hypothetical protein
MSNPESLPPPRYEAVDAQPRVVVATGAALACIAAVCLVTGAWVFQRGAPTRQLQSPIPAGDFRDGAYARTSIEQSWADLDRQSRSHAAGYAWVDRGAGIVRIPIERAIDLVCSEQVHLPQAGTSRR